MSGLLLPSVGRVDDTEATPHPAPIGGWVPYVAPPAAAPSGSATVPAAAGGLATWLPDGRWSTPAALDTPTLPPPDDPAHRRPTFGRGSRTRRHAADPSAPGRAKRVGAHQAAARPEPASPPEPARRVDARPEPVEGSPEPARRSGVGAGRSVVGARRRVAVARVLARLAGWPRRVLAAALALTAGLLLLRPDPPPVAVPAVAAGVPVVVVARDLAAGTTLTGSDVRTVGLPAVAVPAGTVGEVRAVVGRVVAGPVRRGEPLTDARLLGPGLTAGLDAGESTAVPVRLADPDTAALVRAGDRVDVLGTPVQGDTGRSGDAPAGDAVMIATGVRVLAVLRGKEAADGALLFVAAEPSVGRRLAGAAARQRLTVAVRPP